MAKRNSANHGLQQKKITVELVIGAILPFIALIFIGLLKNDYLTLHQKVFKTLVIMISCYSLAAFAVLTSFKGLTGKPLKYLIFFGLFFLYVLIQYFVSFVSGEVSYDRDYLLANYIFLIVFAFFFFYFLQNLDSLLAGSILVSILMAAIIIWSVLSFYDYYTYPGRISAGAYNADLASKMSDEERILFDSIYTKDPSGVFYTRKTRLNSWEKSSLSTLLERNSYSRFSRISYTLTSFRPNLSFGNTDYMSGFLIALIPITFITPILFYRRRVGIKGNIVPILTGIVAVGTIYPLVLSQSTASLIGIYLTAFLFLIPAVIFGFGKFERSRKILMTSVIVGVFVVIPVVLLTIFPEAISAVLPRLSKKLSSPMFAMHDRFNAWAGGWNLFLQHPLFGAGSGTVYAAGFKYISKYFFLYSNSNSFKHSHSEYVEILGEGGIIGLCFFIALNGWLIYRLVRVFSDKNIDFRLRLLGMGTASGLIALLMQQFFSLSLRMSVTMSAYYTLLGISLFIVYYADTLSGRNEKSKKINVILSAVITLSVIPLIIAGHILYNRLYQAENSIMKAHLSETSSDREAYLDRATSIMPENPYAWTEKFSFHQTRLRYLVSDYQENYNPESDSAIKGYYADALNDINMINRSIPEYQDSYGSSFSVRHQYFMYLQSKLSADPSDLSVKNEIDSLLPEVIYYMEKSLGKNFLNRTTHYYNVCYINLTGDSGRVYNAVRDFYESEIILAYGRSRRVAMDKLKISFTDNNNELTAGGGIEHLNVNTGFIGDTVKKITDSDGSNAAVREILNTDRDILFKAFTPDK